MIVCRDYRLDIPSKLRAIDLHSFAEKRAGDDRRCLESINMSPGVAIIMIINADKSLSFFPALSQFPVSPAFIV